MLYGGGFANLSGAVDDYAGKELPQPKDSVFNSALNVHVYPTSRSYLHCNAGLIGV